MFRLMTQCPFLLCLCLCPKVLLRATKWYFFFSLSPFAGSGKNDCCYPAEQGHTKELHIFPSKRGGADLLEKDTETDNLKTTAIWKEQIIPREPCGSVGWNLRWGSRRCWRQNITSTIRIWNDSGHDLPCFMKYRKTKKLPAWWPRAKRNMGRGDLYWIDGIIVLF